MEQLPHLVLAASLEQELDQDVLGELVSFKTQPVRNRHSFNPLLHSSLCAL